MRVMDRDAAADQFLCLACDGVWDVMTNADVAAFLLSVSARMRHKAPSHACRAICALHMLTPPFTYPLSAGTRGPLTQWTLQGRSLMRACA